MQQLHRQYVRLWSRQQWVMLQTTLRAPKQVQPAHEAHRVRGQLLQLAPQSLDLRACTGPCQIHRSLNAMLHCPNRVLNDLAQEGSME